MKTIIEGNHSRGYFVDIRGVHDYPIRHAKVTIRLAEIGLEGTFFLDLSVSAAEKLVAQLDQAINDAKGENDD